MLQLQSITISIPSGLFDWNASLVAFYTTVRTVARALVLVPPLPGRSIISMGTK